MTGGMEQYGCAVALQTAVSIETAGVMRLYGEWRTLHYPGDSQIYYETEFERDGKHFRLVTAQQEEMGMPAAVSLSHKLIERFRPRYLIMPGIAAGIGAEQIFGDVIAADTVWNYSYGKFVSADEAGIQFGTVGFLPRPTSLYLDKEVERYVRRAAKAPDNEFHVHIGPMACGTAVVSNSEVVEKQVRAQFPLTAGLDMESYGVFYAARHASGLKPEPVVVKSICDFADEGKNHIYQKFASFTSSEFARLLYEKYLPLE
ncbi:5'-methylthioadenosine/S-adenosylhomocysteine nucleosidase family protein [Qiania dongpingensis]|uniref:Nucleoside phosphorylase domain-containing protein n=1 Tax=Qiania dongpingensis TaxID=2763669 RepID=A0A7G9G3F1_9FIRM|nr:hypothetical protein [Qiania dongpingensis]QNM05333.1 hypothetical protein H9Q78_12985 [Qiania dongpingensis]